MVTAFSPALTASQSMVYSYFVPGVIGTSVASKAAASPSPIATVEVMNQLKGSTIQVIYQDVHWPAESGSYIGTTSIKMLQELGITKSIVGHSERRRFFCEDNDSIYRKLLACLESGIIPILCIGDSETDKQTRNKVLREQLKGVLGRELTPRVDISRIAIAYEPIWAISTWRDKRPLPTGQEVRDMLDNVRGLLEEVSDQDSSQCSLLFGGSVNPNNALEYFSEPSVDGALVGGASLDAESMASIFEAGLQAWSGS